MAAIDSDRKYTPPKDWAGTEENKPAPIYEVRREWCLPDDDDDNGMRVAAYCVLCAMFVVAGVLVVAVLALAR